MSSVVTAVFHNRASANSAVDALMRAGFVRNDISILMSDVTHGREFSIVEDTKAPEGAAAGAAAGGTLGAIAFGLAAVGSIAVPGLGLLAAGPLVAALAGVGVGGTAGGLIGGLVGAGVPEHEARFYSDRLTEGGILIGIHVTTDRIALAKSILQNSGGESIKTS